MRQVHRHSARSRTRGWPTTALVGGSESQVSERASSSRWSPDRPHGRWPAQSIQAATPVSGSTTSSRGPASSRRSCAGASGGHEPLTQYPSCRSRSGSGRVEVRTNRSTRSTCWAVRRPSTQPAVEPRDHLDVEVDPRPGDRRRGVGVRPRSGEQPVRHPGPAQRLDGAEGVVAIAVGPARDDHHRALDAVVAHAVAQPDRAGPPVGAVPVLPQPGQHPRLVDLQPASPLRPPVAGARLREELFRQMGPTGT